MTDLLPTKILSDEDGPAVEVVNPDGTAAICLVCEHASFAIPTALGSLGLTDMARKSHAVWDPGAAELAQKLATSLDAPLVLGRVSRLVHDCNRPPDRADAMPTRTEDIDIPGNSNLSNDEKAARTREVYDAFHARLTETLDRFEKKPALITVHSFSPTWFGKPRNTEIGLLHDDNDRMAREMLDAARPGFSVELNQPYSAKDGVTHMLAKHAIPRDLDNVMIEVRNDLLQDDPSVQKIAEALLPMITVALSKVTAE